MAVFDELIAQPALSWAFGFGDGAVGAGAVEDADADPAEPTGGLICGPAVRDLELDLDLDVDPTP